VVDAGLCEVLAAVLSDGQLVFLRAAESDLWGGGAGGPSSTRGPLGLPAAAGYTHCPAAAAAAAAVTSNSSSSEAAHDSDSSSGSSRGCDFVFYALRAMGAPQQN